MTNEAPTLVVTSSPQFHDEASTTNIMWTVTVCLLPSAIWGVYVFGIPALWVLVAAVAAAVATEAVIAALMGKVTLWDGSAALTGLLVGMNMPPAVPLYVPVVASFFGIAVVKWTFGGLGTNWMNPALAGRAFVFFSWTGPMSTWSNPLTYQSVDALSTASPLGFIKTGLLEAQGGGLGGPAEFLVARGYPRSLIDGTVTTWLNTYLFGPLGANLPQGYVDLFIGSVPGSIGEVSALLLLAGTVHLFARRIITWEIPLAYLGSFSLLVWTFGGLGFGTGLFSGDVLFHLLSGGLILGVFFMATDIVTSPMTPLGMLLYGAGAGFLTFLIRLYGSFPEGVSLAILVMNIFVPMINRYLVPRRYGVTGGGA